MNANNQSNSKTPANSNAPKLKLPDHEDLLQRVLAENFSVETREKKGAATTKKSLATTSKPTSRIVDETNKYKNQSFIITGAPKPPSPQKS